MTLVNETATRNFIEQAGQRVLTTAQLAESYGTESKRITNNFSENKRRYEEGKHYFSLEGEALKEFKLTTPEFRASSRISKLYLWTEKRSMATRKIIKHR